MNLIEFLSPVLRQKFKFIIIFILTFSAIYGLTYLLPDIQKITIYFSIKPVATSEKDSTYLIGNGIEEGSKVAETISGWAKNPAFRDEILKTAEIYIPHFKNKITAKKQNRLNVFWTIKLYNEEKKHSEKITQALIKTFENNFIDFNQNSVFPFGHSKPLISSEIQSIPISWKITGTSIFGLFFTFVFLYLCESFRKILSFSSKIREMFPDSPVLTISEKIGKHDKKLLEQFVLTFESPRLISTFPDKNGIFSVAPIDTINEEIDTPILLVRVGKTKTQELENLKAIFGEDLGIVVFEQ